MTAELAASEYGKGEPVAILHGLFGSARNWASIARRLAAHHRVIAFDLRNHAASPWEATMGYREMAEDVSTAMRARGHQSYALIGHSLGGKTAMVLALDHPDAVARLVVVDIAPVAYPIAFLAYVRAMRALDLGAVTRRRDADLRLGRTIGDPAERNFLLQSLVLGDGPPRWRLNLAAIEAALPEIAAFPHPPPGRRYDGPALFIAGGASRAVLPAYEKGILALFPRATIARIPEAGHWLHVERSDAFLKLVEPFLTEQGPDIARRRDAD